MCDAWVILNNLSWFVSDLFCALRCDVLVFGVTVCLRQNYSSKIDENTDVSSGLFSLSFIFFPSSVYTYFIKLGGEGPNIEH